MGDDNAEVTVAVMALSQRAQPGYGGKWTPWIVNGRACTMQVPLSSIEMSGLKLTSGSKLTADSLRRVNEARGSAGELK